MTNETKNHISFKPTIIDSDNTISFEQMCWFYLGMLADYCKHAYNKDHRVHLQYPVFKNFFYFRQSFYFTTEIFFRKFDEYVSPFNCTLKVHIKTKGSSLLTDYTLIVQKRDDYGFRSEEKTTAVNTGISAQYLWEVFRDVEDKIKDITSKPYMFNIPTQE